MHGVETVASVAGFNLLGGTPAANCGLVVVKLVPWEERQKPGMSQQAFIGKAFAYLSQIKEAVAMPFGVPALPGMGGTSGASFVLEDLTGTHPKRLQDMASRIQRVAQKKSKISQSIYNFHS